DAEINSLMQTIETLETKAEKTTSTLDPERVEKTSQNDYRENSREDTIVKMIDYKNKINDKIDELVDLKDEIFDKVYKMKEGNYRTLLILRYINLYTFEKIAVEMNYSYRNILYMHGHALQEFEALHCIAHKEDGIV